MRKTKDVKIEAGRDEGKTFVITEMSAVRTEKWAWRVFLALGKSGVYIPPDLVEQGLAGLAIVGLSALSRADFVEVEPLMDELWTCVQIQEPIGNRPPTEDDIEDAATIMRIRREALELHWDFLKAVVASNSGPGAMTAGNT